jgi:DNA-directed RNA polymerase subunit RPC12/RpoP
MRANEKAYRCGVCGVTLFENIQISPGFVCHECQTHFMRDQIGIKIAREPSEEWKRRNRDSWESVKKYYASGNYIEIFTR